VLRAIETNAAFAILESAAASKIDLLVVGVRSRTGLAKLSLGSTAEKDFGFGRDRCSSHSSA